MKALDRIILIALVVGVWALVLTPGTPAAHHEGAGHKCSVSGDAIGPPLPVIAIDTLSRRSVFGAMVMSPSMVTVSDKSRL